MGIAKYRKQADDQLRCQTIQVDRNGPRDPRYDARLLEILMDVINPDCNGLGQVVILLAGDGQWNKVVDMAYMSNGIKSFLSWENNERSGLRYHTKSVEIITEDVTKAQPPWSDTLLSNVSQPDPAIEVENLKLIMRWFEQSLNCMRRYVIRITNFTHPFVLEQMGSLIAQARGHIVGITNGSPDEGFIDDLFLVSKPRYSKNSQQATLYPELSSFSMRPRGKELEMAEEDRDIRAVWPTPGPLPVKHLLPLDMGATIEGHLDKVRESTNISLENPLNVTKFCKEIGWYRKRTNSNNIERREPTFEHFIEQLDPLIKISEWMLTSYDPATLSKTFTDKYDNAPEENHNHYPRLWEAYQGLSMFLRDKGIRLSKLGYDEVGTVMNRNSKMGYHDYYLKFKRMGDYLDKPMIWRKNVDAFKAALMAGRPIKADFFAIGRREHKKDNKPRIVFCSCATLRLYEATVLGTVDQILREIPFSMHRLQVHKSGELFRKLMYEANEERVAVCDDISKWDTRVSYSVLCLEAAFLQLLTDEEDHKKEIENLYRLYAHAVINVPRCIDGEHQQHNVLYQVQGQVQSGRRVTYAMNTITNMVVNMCRAAKSQGVSVEATKEWVMSTLAKGHSSKFGGKVSGDDTVILMAPEEAKLFAEEVDLINDMGLRRKETGDGPSRIITHFEDINFCSRSYVKVPMYNDSREIVEYRYIPTMRVDEVIIRKLIRPDEVAPEKERALAWVREQARNLLMEHFHSPTLRLLALAILSATPRGIRLTGNDKGWSAILGDHFTADSIVQLLNERLFGDKAENKSSYRAKRLADIGFMSHEDAAIYELEMTSSAYQEWIRDLNIRIESWREISRPGQYDDWVKHYEFNAEDPMMKQIRPLTKLDSDNNGNSLPSPDKKRHAPIQID